MSEPDECWARGKPNNTWQIGTATTIKRVTTGRILLMITVSLTLVALLSFVAKVWGQNLASL